MIGEQEFAHFYSRNNECVHEFLKSRGIKVKKSERLNSTTWLYHTEKLGSQTDLIIIREAIGK